MKAKNPRCDRWLNMTVTFSSQVHVHPHDQVNSIFDEIDYAFVEEYLCIYSSKYP